MSWEENVFSSNISRVGYNHETEELIVHWQNGKTSAYAGVPESLAHEIANAQSVGSAINAQIKPIYAHRYI